MSSAALLRPGSAIGPYPQREDVRDGWLDKMADGLSGFVRQHVHNRNPRFQVFVDDVNQHSMGLDELSEKELKSKISELRTRLYSEGINDELVAESFAMVREMTSRHLGMRHFDVQLYGGWVMLQGKIAEMETGEGKTLTATLPACTAALAGIPVHIVTVNDFLVTRDAKWMNPVYQALGLTVGTITEELSLEERRAAYACDITYCTNKQLTFDYLKDRILLDQEDRRLHLQLEGLYKEKPRTSRLLMRGLCFAIVDEADSVLIDEARTPLIISSQGKVDQEEIIYKQSLKFARKLTHPRDFVLNARDKRVDLTDLGKAQIRHLTRGMGSIWSGVKRRDELIKQALSALHLYLIDKHYLVKDGKVQIIDEYTGRVMADRSWERGLHQMIETKEGCAISSRQETLARISYQKFFRRYLRLGGMTGTAQEVTQELRSVYRLNVVRVPTNKPVLRQHLEDLVYATAELKWEKILTTISELHKQHRPVLIGTKSVATSEYLSKLLLEAKLPHQVLNARQDQEEAQIITQAGHTGHITVATNMAGRGTDIRLSPGIAELGGLHVLATERHEARRIDRQLFGRGGRQGEPGSYQTIVSIEDEFMTDFYGNVLQRFFKQRQQPLPDWLGKILVGIAQISAEYYHSRLRRDLLKQDDSLGDMLSFSGRGE